MVEIIVYFIETNNMDYESIDFIDNLEKVFTAVSNEKPVVGVVTRMEIEKIDEDVVYISMAEAFSSVEDKVGTWFIGIDDTIVVAGT